MEKCEQTFVENTEIFKPNKTSSSQNRLPLKETFKSKSFGARVFDNYDYVSVCGKKVPKYAFRLQQEKRRRRRTVMNAEKKPNDPKTYSPGEFYNVASGFTYADWINPKYYASSILAPQEFINEKADANDVIILFNASGRDLAVSVEVPASTNTNAVAGARFNQFQLEELDLVHGEAKAVNVDSQSITFHLNSSVPNGRLQTTPLTGPGWNFADLEDTTITVFNSRPTGMPAISTRSEELNQHYKIINRMNTNLIASLKRNNAGRALSEEEVTKQKADRKADRGNSPLTEVTIAPGGVYLARPPTAEFIVRAMSTRDEQQGNAEEGMFTDITNIPSLDSYVEFPAATVRATASQAVIFLLDETGESVEAYAFDMKDLKMVNPKLAITE